MQTATVEAPTPEENRFGTAVIDRPGAPDFSPPRVHAPGCVLYFIKDHPRREWCSTACGNRARAARHYARHTRNTKAPTTDSPAS